MVPVNDGVQPAFPEREYEIVSGSIVPGCDALTDDRFLEWSTIRCCDDLIEWHVLRERDALQTSNERLSALRLNGRVLVKL
jgi:hypothetical protein